MGRRRKKTRTHVADNSNAQSALKSSEENKIPKSLVIRRGKCENEVGELVDDMRRLMLPYTALHFQEDPKNRKLTLSKYCKELALPMGISHIMAFSQNDERLNLRLARTPEGPTMTFRVNQFSLAKHIKALQRRPVSDKNRSIHQNPPIVVTKNFGDASAPPHVKLMRITFQNMFPPINVATVKLTECRRVALFHLIEEEVEEDGEKKKRDVVHLRHYAIKGTPVGASRKVRRIIQTKVPNLNRVDDIADYITGAATSVGYDSGAASDSEAEDDHNVIKLPQNYSGAGNVQSQKSALKLIELGPRLSMQLIKVEKGLGAGDVMYHAHVRKTPQEAKALKERKAREKELKHQRRAQQEQNVERKRKALEEKREQKKLRKESRENEMMEQIKQQKRLARDAQKQGQTEDSSGAASEANDDSE